MTDPAPSRPKPTTRWWLYTVLAVLFVLAMRIHWVDMSVTRLAYWDEVSAELLAEAHRGPGELPAMADLVRPHDEHRILWQRLLAHGLIEANDRVWDSRLRCMVNAVFAALYAGLLANAFRGGHQGRPGHLLFWPSVVLVASPIAYQNMTFGFQTSFHLQMLFSIAAFAGLAGSPWRTIYWWLGAAAAVAAIFTNGSGFFTAPILLVWIGIDLARREDGRWFPAFRQRILRHLPNLIFSILILNLGLALLHRPENAAGQQASGIGEFLHGLAKHLSWPWQDSPWLAPLVWSPFLILFLLAVCGRGGGAWLCSARFTLCFGGWLLLNLLAMAYARGALAIGPVPRYEDFHLLGIATNAASLVLIAINVTVFRNKLIRLSLPVGGLLWTSASVSGLCVLAHSAWRVELPDYHAFGQIRERNTARFTLDGDASVFEGYVSRFHLPYDQAGELKEWLSDPSVAALLPANFRSPASAVTAAVRTGTCLASELPHGISIPPAERLLASSFDRDPGGAGAESSATSGPLQAPSGAFRLFYLGMDTGGSLKLRLKPEGSGKAIPILTERRHGTSTWMPITVDVDPEKTYRLEFKDGSRGGWGAVTLPVNEPPLSRISDTAGSIALPSGILAILFILAVAAWPAGRSAHPPESSPA